MRHLGLAVAFALALVPVSPAKGASRSLVVVPLGPDPSYRMAARISIAIQRVLASRGRVVESAAVALQPPRGPSAAALAKAKAKYLEAVELYDGLDFKKAQRAFKEATKLYREVLSRGGSSTEYVKSLHYLAAALLYDNERKSALKFFAEAHAFNPKQAPDDSVFSPDVFKSYQEAISATVSKGALTITSTPPAEVMVNGRVVGATPLTTRRKPGWYLVTCRRAGYESDSQWIAIKAGGRGEVQTELTPASQKLTYQQTLTTVRKEINTPGPGPATGRLRKLLNAGALILVTYHAGKATAIWCDGNKWTKRYLGSVPAGAEKGFARQFAATAAVVVRKGCKVGDCSDGQQCVGGRCVALQRTKKGTPFYKTWWFWTIVGVAVAGGTAGAVVATVNRSESWTAELKPGGMQ